jgi:hypothetical protein
MHQMSNKFREKYFSWFTYSLKISQHMKSMGQAKYRL